MGICPVLFFQQARHELAKLRGRAHMSRRMSIAPRGPWVYTSVVYLGIADGTPIPARWTCRRRCRDRAIFRVGDAEDLRDVDRYVSQR